MRPLRAWLLLLLIPVLTSLMVLGCGHHSSGGGGGGPPPPPPPPSSVTLTKVGGDNQSGTHGTTLPIALTVSATDPATGAAAPGISISFKDNSSSLVTTLVTDSTGAAAFSYQLPAAPAVYSVTAQAASGTSSNTITFTETSQ